jgi:hypothetical protein
MARSVEERGKGNTECCHFMAHTSLEREPLMTRMQADGPSLPDEFSCHARWKRNLRIHAGRG